MDGIRTFVAIELGAELVTALNQLERQLDRTPGARAIRWVAPANIHLTLKFLGNIPPARIEQLGGALEQAARGVGPLTLDARGVGCFPNSRRPRVVWVGLDGDVPRLKELVRRIENALAAAGIPREDRPFSPHLTLGRVKRESSNDERAALGQAIEQIPETSFGAIRADAVQFVKSDLRPAGPIYVKLKTILL